MDADTDLGENRGTSGRTSGRIVTSDGVCGHGGDSTGSIRSNVPPDGHVDAYKLADGVHSTGDITGAWYWGEPVDMDGATIDVVIGPPDLA